MIYNIPAHSDQMLDEWMILYTRYAGVEAGSLLDEYSFVQ
jgi:hypothetical protein